MPQQPQPSVLNNFSSGFKTEFTGLNFPENSFTDTDNCVPSIIGNVTRREGIDYETNFTTKTINRASSAISSYRWLNAGGDGSTQIYVLQVGATLYFYQSSNATVASPLSTTALVSTVTISNFLAGGGTFDATLECQFADGNGYLFVFHPNCDPFYCTYNAGTITGTLITIQIRDFAGIPDNLAATFRPSTLSAEHQYNLLNQGWTVVPPWGASTGFPPQIGPSGQLNQTFAIISQTNGTSITAGSSVVNGTFTGNAGSISFVANFTGFVTSYTSPNSITLNILSYSDNRGGTSVNTGLYSNRTCSLTLQTTGYIGNWFSAINNYPSNSDIWFTYKNSSGTFNPLQTINNITPSGLAGKGSIILNAFVQNRTAITGISGLTSVSTTARPRTGAFFQGRVWYTGVDSSQQATGDAPYTTWTENIYFSQIIENTTQFGYCYQLNDPTNEKFFDLLPSDGGVITIQGSGPIYKLFPIQNGLLVFAANGIWYITGSTGIGFAATDYSIVNISSVRTISSSSFVSVLGAPFWWNEEGIYTVVQGQGHEGLQYGAARGAAINTGLNVENICLGTILSFYANIPLQSKKYVRGYYNPIDYVIQWTYRDTNESSVTDRYEFNRILNYNTATKAFYPWTISATPHIHDVTYVSGPGGSTSPSPSFKYLTSNPSGGSYLFTFSEEKDSTNWVDWYSLDNIGDNYSSYFVTGYRFKGQAQHKFQSEYIYVYSNNAVNTSYRMQGVWLYGTNRNSGKYSSLERVNITDSTANFSNVIRRHRIRGRGVVNQFRIESVDGAPFNIIGWSVDDKVSVGQ